MRIRSVLATCVAAAVATVVAGTGSAAAETPLGQGNTDEAPAHAAPAPWPAPGNRQTAWFTPLGLVNADALRATATGRIRIDHWGTSKAIAGELPVAGRGWPAPGLPRYMLIGNLSDNGGSAPILVKQWIFLVKQWI